MKNKWRSLICAGCILWAAGLWYQPAEVAADMGNYNFVSIDSGTVDTITVNGVTVEARYRPYDVSVNTDTTYSCAAFVKRFYNQVYGREVSGLLSVDSVPVIDSGSFYQTDSPKAGDVIRDNVSVHWAIVKSVEGDTVTVIQQNAWDGSYTKAWVGATIQKGDSRYTFFTWSGDHSQNTTAQARYLVNDQQPQIQENTAVISAVVDNPNRDLIKQVGCYLWDDRQNLIRKHTENCQRAESRFHMWYDIKEELGITLTSGTVYRYQLFVVQDGTEYTGSVREFTTAGTSPETVGEEKNAAEEVKESDKAKVEDSEISRTIGKLKELYGWSEESVEEKLSGLYRTEITADGIIQHYSIETLMDRQAELIVTMKNGKVEKVEWKYIYSEDTKETMKISQELYEQICTITDGIMKTEAKGICKDNNNMTYTYKNKISIVRDKEETPYVAITILGEFEELFY